MMVTATDAARKFSGLVDRVLRGEVATVTRNGRPVVEVRRLESECPAHGPVTGRQCPGCLEQVRKNTPIRLKPASTEPRCDEREPGACPGCGMMIGHAESCPEVPEGVAVR